MNPRDYDKIFDSFSFDPVTEINIKTQDPVTPGNSYHYTPISVEQRPEKTAEELLGSGPLKYEEQSDEEEIEVPFPNKYGGLKDFYTAIEGSAVKTKDAKYALLAQMGVESGWGKKSEGSKYYNYGNITTGSSWKGDYFKGKDTDAKGNKITQKFRKYKSADAFFNDYIKLIKNLYPEAYDQLTADQFDIDKFSYGLRHGRVGMYAESPEYEDSLRTVFNSVKRSMTPQPEFESRKRGGILYNY